jgi:hypothetical protein
MKQIKPLFSKKKTFIAVIVVIFSLLFLMGYLFLRTKNNQNIDISNYDSKNALEYKDSKGFEFQYNPSLVIKYQGYSASTYTLSLGLDEDVTDDFHFTLEIFQNNCYDFLEDRDFYDRYSWVKVNDNSAIYTEVFGAYDSYYVKVCLNNRNSLFLFSYEYPKGTPKDIQNRNRRYFNQILSTFSSDYDDYSELEKMVIY